MRPLARCSVLLSVAALWSCAPQVLVSNSRCDAGGPLGTKQCDLHCIPLADCCTDEDCVAAPSVCFDGHGTCTPNDSGGHACVFKARPTGTACETDSNACTDDRCDDSGRCLHPYNTVLCDDGLGCTTDDHCQLGLCQGTTSCGGSPGPCYQVGSCGADGGCAFVPKPSTAGCADDGVACTDDLCDGAGACAHPPRAANSPCDDGKACSANDVCSNGFCVGTVSCTSAPGECYQSPGTCGASGACEYPAKATSASCSPDSNACTDDHCDGAGACVHPNNTKPCDDGKACTSGDACAGGACAGTVSCTSAPGECWTATGICGAGGACAYAPKANTAPCTTDTNVCTDDHCDGLGACVHTNNTAACDDLNACTTSDHCSAGACTGTAVTCGGGKVCSGGSCACSSGQLFCTGNASCQATATTCADLTCGACGVLSACDGTVVHDPVSGWDTTCASTLPACTSANAMASNAADQQRYYQGYDFTCVKQNGVYGWRKRVSSAAGGGLGCQTAYPHCTFICSAPLSYSAYCDSASNWNTTLSGVTADGCAGLSPLPGGYACP